MFFVLNNNVVVVCKLIIINRGGDCYLLGSQLVYKSLRFIIYTENHDLSMCSKEGNFVGCLWLWWLVGYERISGISIPAVEFSGDKCDECKCHVL